MNRIGDGLRMLRMSWRIVRTTPALLILPVCGAISFAAVAGLGFFASIALQELVSGSLLLALLGWLLYFAVGYFWAVFCIALFGAATVTAAQRRLRGVPAATGPALRSAWSHRSPLLKWALITTSVGLFPRHEENSSNALMRNLAGGLDLTWSVGTFLVVPVIMAEDASPSTALTRARMLFQQRWAEEVSGYAGFNVLLALAAALVLFGAAALGISGSLVAGIVLAAVCGGLLLILSSAMRCTFAAVVYHSVTEPLPVAAHA